MNWENKLQDIGTVFVGEKYLVKFKSINKLDILSLKSSCGCTKANYDQETKILSVNYTPNPIPRHLREKGEYVTTKTITITYKNGDSEIVSFKAKIIKK